MAFQAVKMTSVKTQLPYEYYTLPFCQPQDGNIKYKSLNLGKRKMQPFCFIAYDCNMQALTVIFNR